MAANEEENAVPPADAPVTTPNADAPSTDDAPLAAPPASAAEEANKAPEDVKAEEPAEVSEAKPLEEVAGNGEVPEAKDANDVPAASNDASINDAAAAPDAEADKAPDAEAATAPVTTEAEAAEAPEDAAPQLKASENALGNVEVQLHLETKYEMQELDQALQAIFGKLLEPSGITNSHLTISVCACEKPETFVGVAEIIVPPEAQSVDAVCAVLEPPDGKGGLLNAIKSDPKLSVLFNGISTPEKADPEHAKSMEQKRDEVVQASCDAAKAVEEELERRAHCVEEAKAAVKSAIDRISELYQQASDDVSSTPDFVGYARAHVEYYFVGKKDLAEIEKEVKAAIVQALSSYGVLPEHVTTCVSSCSTQTPHAVAVSEIRLVQAGASAVGALRVLEEKGGLNESHFSLRFLQPAVTDVTWPVRAVSRGLKKQCGKNVSEAVVEQLATTVGAAAKSMNKAWAAARALEAEKAEEYMALAPRVLHEESCLVQDVSSAIQLREDAEKASTLVLERIKGPGCELTWLEDPADEKKKKRAEISSDHPWWASPSVSLLEPEVLGMEFIQDEIKALEEKQSYCVIPRHQLLLDVSRVDLIYGSTDGLLKGLTTVMETFDVVSINDTYDHPGFPEHGSLSVGIRIPLDNTKHHVGQIRLSLKGLHEAGKLHMRELQEGLSKLLLSAEIPLASDAELGMCRKFYLLQWLTERLCCTEGVDTAVLASMQNQVYQVFPSSKSDAYISDGDCRSALMALKMRVHAAGMKEQADAENVVQEGAKQAAAKVEQHVKAEEEAEAARKQAAEEAAKKAAEEAAAKKAEEERLAAEAKARAEAEARAAEDLARRKAAAQKRFAELEAAEEANMEAMTAFWTAQNEGSARVQVELPLRGTGIRADLLRLSQDAVAQTLARFQVLPEHITGTVRGDGSGGWVASLEVNLIWDEASVMGIVAALEDALGDKSSPLRSHADLYVDPTNAHMAPIWPLAGLAAGVKAMHKLIMPRDKVQELAQIVEDSAQMFLEVQCGLWEREPVDLQKLWELDSNKLGLINEQVTQVNDISVPELLLDAQEAQKVLKEMLASADCWEAVGDKPAAPAEGAVQQIAAADAAPPPDQVDVPRGPALVALEKKVAELPGRDSQFYSEYKLHGAKEGVAVNHPGLVSAMCRIHTQESLEAQGVALERPHHLTGPPFHTIVDALKLDIIYSSASQLLAALQEIRDCKAFSVASIDNTFHHPPALGYAGVTVRVKVPTKKGTQHVATIRLLLKELEELLETGTPEFEERIDAVISACAERSRITLAQPQALRQGILQLLDRTEGVELADLEYTKTELVRAEAALNSSDSKGLLGKDRLACLRKLISALENRQKFREVQRTQDLRMRQEVAERAKRFKAPPAKEIPMGLHNPKLHQELDDRLGGMWDSWSSWPTRGQAGRTADAVRLTRLAQPRPDRSIQAQAKRAKDARKQEVSASSISKTMLSIRPSSPRRPATTWAGSAKRTNPRKILGTLPRSDQTSWMTHLFPECDLGSTSKSLKAPSSPKVVNSKQFSEEPSIL